MPTSRHFPRLLSVKQKIIYHQKCELKKQVIKILTGAIRWYPFSQYCWAAPVKQMIASPFALHKHNLFIFHYAQHYWDTVLLSWFVPCLTLTTSKEINTLPLKHFQVPSAKFYLIFYNTGFETLFFSILYLQSSNIYTMQMKSEHNAFSFRQMTICSQQTHFHTKYKAIVSVGKHYTESSYRFFHKINLT